MAMILVTHDLGVVAGRADDIAVMYAGRIVEQAPAAALFANVRHPYTEALLQSIPKLEMAKPHPARGHRRPPAGPGQPARRAARSPRAARYAQDRCLAEEPELAARPGRPRPTWCACYFPVGTAGRSTRRRTSPPRHRRRADEPGRRRTVDRSRSAEERA